MGGKYSREKRKAPGFLAGFLVGLIVAAAVMAAVHYLPNLLDQTPPTQETTEQPATDAEQPSESTEATEQTNPVQKPDNTVSDIQIDTPYCILHYPAQWSQNIKILTDETPEKFTVTVCGLIGDREAELFAVVFGESEEMPIGTLVGDDGTEVTVRLNLELFSPDESWTEAETNTAYDMIDGSAYLMEALTELENFR